MNNALLFILCLFVFSFESEFASANVETIQIKRGETISRSASISPGFAVMFQFPEDVLSLTLADQTVFSCDRMPSQDYRIMCKPLTHQKFSTNLVVTTESNEFNIILTVDGFGEKNPFKYVFTHGGGSEHQITRSSVSKPSQSFSVLDLLAQGFSVKPCSLKGKSMSGSFVCESLVQIGSDSFVDFKIISKNKKTDLIKVSMVRQSLGGMTGLVVQDEASVDVPFRLHTNSDSGVITGLIQVPNVSKETTSRHVLKLLTNSENQPDIIVHGL